MRIIVAVIVYDRFKNIEEWVRCWNFCEKDDAELFIIHNYKNQAEKSKYEEFCKNAGVSYIPRKNVGMDIGALQDVCRGRLEGFPNQWDYLFWTTDDILPMSKKFLPYYMGEIQKPGIGVVCLELSKEIKLHIRTTGFLMSQMTASKITFPVDIINTKDHCYEFEHRGRNAFYEQIRKLGLSSIQVHPVLKYSYLWDIHIRASLDRWEEHYKEFPIAK